MKPVFSQFFLSLRRAYERGVSASMATFFVLISWSSAASAQTIGDVMNNFCNNLMPYGDLYGYVAYAAGIFFCGSGLLMLAKHTENHNQAPMHQIMARFAGGAFLLALPTFMAMLVNTLFMTSATAGGTLACNFAATPATAGDPTVWFTNLVNNISAPLTTLVSVVAGVMGIGMIVRGLMRAAKYGTDPKTTSITNISVNLLVGCILVAGSQSLDMILGTLFGFGYDQGAVQTSAGDVINWGFIQTVNNSTFTAAVTACLTFFQLVGFISFVRGWKIVKDAVEGSGQATIAQGFTHIIGGVMAINIFNVLEVIDATLGTNFLT